MKKDKNQDGNIYDRIFKENGEALFLPIIEQELGITLKSYAVLPEKFQKTVEREVDFLYDVVLENGTEQLLHIEFQTKNERNMIYRMGFYHALALEKYKKPIRHIVIYLGKTKTKMINQLSSQEIFSGFDIVNLHELDTEKLLSSQIPEVIMLGLLGNYEKDQKERILRLIIKKLIKYSPSKSALSKYITQLILLSRLRNLEGEIINIVYSMPISYDIESDKLFILGQEKGVAKGMTEGERQERIRQEKIAAEKEQIARQKERQSIIRLYHLKLDAESIANALDIPVHRVQQIIREQN